MTRRGIILAGGKGTRLAPLTLATTKCLLPIYDKPMIYYSISTLMLAGIENILIISTPEDSKAFQNLLGDGSNWGINLSFEIQPKPEGIAQALIIGETFVDGNPSCLILGDNLFYGDGLEEKLSSASQSENNNLFSYKVHDPERFGICEIDMNKKVISLEEKPLKPKSDLAVTGLYFYDQDASEIAKSIQPSDRGELEITDVNIEYMKLNKLFSETLDQDFMWIDAGTNKSFLDASNFVFTTEKEQGIKVACPEEIAFRKGLISIEKLEELSHKISKSDYGKYLINLLK